jgi:hypothetical protein
MNVGRDEVVLFVFTNRAPTLTNSWIRPCV